MNPTLTWAILQILATYTILFDGAPSLIFLCHSPRESMVDCNMGRGETVNAKYRSSAFGVDQIVGIISELSTLTSVCCVGKFPVQHYVQVFLQCISNHI